MADDEMDFSTNEQEKECISDTKEVEINQEAKMDENLDDSDDSSDSEEAESEEITALRQFLESSPFHYESHLKLIQALRDIGDLDKTRQARETMSKMFPLTPDLWLGWIQDEQKAEQKAYIRDLFEKAVKDYQSVKLWTEYCQYVLDNMEGEDGIHDARAVFERAITSVGLHLTEGVSIWDGYREFEMALFDSYKTMAEGSDSTQLQQKVEQQKEKVKSIFRRQICVPLIGMQAVFREYEEWLEDEKMLDYVARGFNRAETKLEACLPHEEELTSETSPKLDEYRSYIAYEMKENDLARVQCLYERAMVENCLNSKFWMEYTNYMSFVKTILFPVFPEQAGDTRTFERGVARDQ